MFQRHSRAEGPHFTNSYTFFVFYWFLLRSDYREFQYCIPEARDGYNLGTASGSQISECLNPAVTRYVITWARFELCPRYKSPSSVTRHGASIGLTWLAGRPKPEFPPLLSASRLGRVLGEGGDKYINNHINDNLLKVTTLKILIRTNMNQLKSIENILLSNC